jgi:hypothetical protein
MTYLPANVEVCRKEQLLSLVNRYVQNKAIVSNVGRGC